MKRFKVTEYITPKEARAIIEACSKVRDKLILRTMWETGGRVAEVLSLIPDNIDIINNCIYLPNLKQQTIRKRKDESSKEFAERKEKLKKRLEERKELIKIMKRPILDRESPPLKACYLFKESILCQDLLKYVGENNIGGKEWLFRSSKSKTGQVSTAYIWYLLSAIKETSYSSIKWKRKNGLATILGVRKIKGGIRKPAWPHLFRHGAAMNIYHRTQRLDVTQKQLGHTTVMTTEGYAELTDEDRKKVINNAELN